MKEINNIVKKNSIIKSLSDYYPSKLKGTLVIKTESEYLDFGEIFTEHPNTLYKELKALPEVESVRFSVK